MYKMYNLLLARALLLFMVLASWYSIYILGKHAVYLCSQSFFMIPVFVCGIASLPYTFYFVRSYLQVIWTVLVKNVCWRKHADLMKEHRYSAVVLPSDCDVFNHMNNSRYQREADFARLKFYGDTALMKDFRRTKNYWIMNSCVIRYRRSLEVFQRFTVTTKIVFWDEKHVFLQHKFLTQDESGTEFVNAISIERMRVCGGETTDEFLRGILKSSSPPERPPLSPEMQDFINYIETCSSNLKKDQNTSKTS